MLPFILLIFVPIMIQHTKINGIDYQKKNDFSLTVFFVFLTILIMLRHEGVGNDTRNYIHYFERFAKIEWSKLGQQHLELGFAFFNKVISVFSSVPQVFLAIVSVVVSALIFPTYKRLCRDASLTIVLFCVMSTFVMMFSGIRQMLAIGIGFVSYRYTREKKFFAFLISVVVAMSFHISAFMLFLMYPLYHVRITKKWLYFVVPVMMVAFVFNRQIFAVLTGILARFSRFDGTMASTGAYTMLLLFAAFA